MPVLSLHFAILSIITGVRNIESQYVLQDNIETILQMSFQIKLSVPGLNPLTPNWPYMAT